MSEKKICLLRISPESKGRVMRVMEFAINGKKGLYEFEVEKIFKEEAEAKKYSEENNIPLEIDTNKLIITDKDESEKPKMKEKSPLKKIFE
ncbi:MAG: hypothetical protein GPJ52_12720 [Candidatus Heimdallarchaeota archaeon]|nr:hypothetical protein [Candidatus Heimdallarchaeota archaeon]